MKTIDIKGKDYVMVNERILYFRANFPEHKIQTRMLSNENGICIFHCAIVNDKNEIVATGHAYEKEGSTYINKTSYIENCETSAVGRALGMMGIGIDNSIATAEEVANVIANQNKPTIKQSVTAIWTGKLVDIESAYEEAKMQVVDAYKKIINPNRS